VQNEGANEWEGSVTWLLTVSWALSRLRLADREGNLRSKADSACFAKGFGWRRIRPVRDEARKRAGDGGRETKQRGMGKERKKISATLNIKSSPAEKGAEKIKRRRSDFGTRHSTQRAIPQEVAGNEKIKTANNTRTWTVS